MPKAVKEYYKENVIRNWDSQIAIMMQLAMITYQNHSAEDIFVALSELGSYH